MRSVLFCLAVLLAALPASAQYPIPVVSDGTSHEILDIEHASDAGLYVVGTFGTALALEPDWPEPTLEWSAPNGTGFLARFDNAGVLQWAHALEARRAGFNDPSSAFPKRIAALDDGSVVLMGTVTPGILIDLDPGPGEAIVQPQTGDPLAFVVRYSAAGAYLWHQAVPTTGAFSTAHPMGLGVDGGTVYALLPPSPDADPGPAEVPYFVPSILALDAADGAPQFTAETTIPSSGGPVAVALAAGGGSVYVVGHHGSLAVQRFTLARHDATTGAMIWTYTPTDGRDRMDKLEVDAGGTLYVSGELTSSATGVALDPSMPGTITLSRNGDVRAFLAAYDPSGSLGWAAGAEVNVGAFGSGFAVQGDEAFVAGFGTIRAYSTADGSFLRALAAQHGTPSLYSVATTQSRVSVYAQPRNDGFFAFEGLPAGSPPTVIVQLDQEDLALSTNPVAIETPVSRDGLSIRAPNPVTRRAEVVLRLAEAAPVTLRLFDALGREVARLHEGPLGAGEHRLGLEASALPAGAYVLVLTSEGARVSRRVVVAR